MNGFFVYADSRSASIRLAALFLLLTVAAAATAAAISWTVAQLLFGADADTSLLVSGCAGIVSLFLICAGAVSGLRAAGKGAGALAGRLGALPLMEDDPLHGDLLRVAEETAIAAGIPVPMLFILPAPSINALTLGDSPSAAVLLVTRGALEQLDGEELRGLVAHELAHVFRGDNATNTRLAALLHGFLWPRALQHEWRRTHKGGSLAQNPVDALHAADSGRPAQKMLVDRSRRLRWPGFGSLVTLPLDVLLALAALAGMPWVRLAWFFVHVRREYVADTLAVRFTGDREGLGRVLRRIDGEAQTALPGRHAAAIEHFLFVPSRLRWSAARIDEHLAGRIRRLYGRRMPRIGVCGIPDRKPRIASLVQASAQVVCSPEGAAVPFCTEPSGAQTALRTDANRAESPSLASVSPESPGQPDAAPDCGVLAYRETVPGAPEYRLAGDGLSWFSSQVASGLGCADAGAARQLEVLVGCSRSASFDDGLAGRWLGLLAAGVAEFPAEQATRTAPGSDRLAVDHAGRWPGEAGSCPDPADAALGWILSPKGAPWRMPLFELLLARTRGWSIARRRTLLEHCRRAVASRARDNPSAWVYYTLAQHRLSLASTDFVQTQRTLVSRFDQSRALAILFAMASILAEASARNTRDALADAALLLTISPPAATPDRVSAIELTRSLEILAVLPAFSKPILLKVLGRLARSPQEPVYQAFLRAVAAAIDCPAPRRTGWRRVPARSTPSGKDRQPQLY